MGSTDPQALLDLDAGSFDAAMRAFVSWAGSDVELRILFTPDVLLAIDTPRRRGFLIDEIYFVTVWIGQGAVEFRECLERELPNGQDQWIEMPLGEKPDPEGFLSTAMRHGRPLADVRRLR